MNLDNDANNRLTNMAGRARHALHGLWCAALEGRPVGIRSLPFFLVLAVLGFVQPVFAFYDPSAGRWINRDPVVKRNGNSLYQFVQNNSLSKLDALGLNPLDLVNPAPTFTTIQCDGSGNYEIVWGPNDQGSPWEECARLHEEQHIRDYQDRFGANSCQGRPQGSLPVAGPDDEEFLRQSECRANKISLDCIRRTCLGPADWERIKLQIFAHETALQFWNCP